MEGCRSRANRKRDGMLSTGVAGVNRLFFESKNLQLMCSRLYPMLKDSHCSNRALGLLVLQPDRLGADGHKMVVNGSPVPREVAVMAVFGGNGK